MASDDVEHPAPESRRHPPSGCSGRSGAARCWVEPTLHPGALEAGQVIDGFRLDERAQQGGMATLWRVTRVEAEAEPPLIMKVPRIKGGDVPTTIVGFEVEQMIIVDYARKNQIDHIVMGARSSGGLRRDLGSVSAQVAAEAGCTVTVVRSPGSGD
jgi:hypothetical protein